ncbi:MAG TPA: DUF4124 domain-containing protein [Burkholderiaceae bacterium]|nr:DUF4124 domain-containing protein [Burkholderiaceae bacterium]
MPKAHITLIRPALVAACLVLASSAFAQSEVYKCLGEGGAIEYRNVGDTKGCKRIDNAPVTVVPSNRAASAPRATPSAPSAAQKQREDDRRTILESELKAQEDRLAALRKEFNEGEPERRGDERNYQKYLDRVAQLKEDIARAESNIASLKRELGTLGPSGSAAR